MERGYQKLIREHGLNEQDLPKDVKVLISSIRASEKAIKLNLDKGKKVSESANDKVRLMDEQAVYKILDYIEEQDEDEEEDELEQQRQEEENKNNEDHKENPKQPDPKGLKIDQELSAAVLAGKTKLTQEEFKEVAPVAYNLVFDNYEQGQENGIQTSFYSVIEKENLFHISKN